MHTEEDTLESIFESLESSPAAERMFEQRPRLNAHLATPRQPIVHNIPIRSPPPPYAAVSATATSLSLFVFCMLMLTKEPVCYGCAFTSLLAGLFAFWAGFLSAIKINSHQ